MARKEKRCVNQMKPPQTRYRVKEQGGQLVVIDTYNGGAPATARGRVSRGTCSISTSTGMGLSSR